MTISEAISAVDALKPNSFSKAQKLSWLSELDGIVQRELCDTHKNGGSFSGYTESTDGSTNLKVPAPYCVMYLYYMMSKIDFFNAETSKFNVSSEMFNNLYLTYTHEYNRTHVPLQNNSISFTGGI